MTTKRIEQGEWGRYFDLNGGALKGRKATLQVIGPDIGAQVAAEGLRIVGVAYDPKDRLLEIALDGLDHLIRHPQEIHVDEALHGAMVIEAVDGDGRKHIVQVDGA